MADTLKKVALAGAIIVGSVGGSYAAVTTAPATAPINAQVEMAIATGTSVQNLKGVGMVQSGFGAHMHLTWDNVANAKGYNIYVDGKKVNDKPVVTTGNVSHYMLTNDSFKAGVSYKVSVSVIGADDKESTQSEVSVAIPAK